MGLESIPLTSVRRWLFTTNHKDIGILYLLTSFVFMIIGGALALLMRVQLVAPDIKFLSPSAFNQAVTVHGLVMVLWFISPMAFGLANYVVPLQIGARDLAFPRLNALSYWLYLFGGLLAALGFFTPGGAIDTGWTVYAPLNTAKYSPQVGVTLGGAGLLMLIASVTASTINFIVTIFRLRAPGLKLKYMPMYTWGILLTVFMMLFAFPPLAAAVIMLAADRILGTLFFVSNEGGALLWDHLFWFFGHPEVYIVLLPGLLAIAEVVPVFARRPLYGKRVVIIAAVIGSMMSFMVWAHHMFVTGINPLFRKFMTITTESISIPFGIITLALILTLFKSSIRFKTPMLFAIGAIALFTMGGITGVYNSSVALDYYLRGTYWIVAHFHFTLVGGTLTGLLAALYYWWPKMTGRMFNERLGKVHFVVYMIGFNLLYFPMHFLIDMPRRVHTYPAGMGWELPNFLATAGGFVFALSFLLMFWNLLNSLRYGPPAGDNPWHSWSLEWMTPSPPPRHDFDGQPVVRSDGSMEIQPLMTNGASVHIEHFSPWPLLLSLSLFVIFAGVLLFAPALYVGMLLLVVSLIGWAREDLRAIYKIEHVEGEAWPFSGVDNIRLGIWTLIYSEATLFGALLATYAYLRFNSSSWLSVGEIAGYFNGTLNTFVLLTSSLTLAIALVGLKMGNMTAAKGGMIGTLLLGLAFLAIKGLEWTELSHEGFVPASSLSASTFYIITGAHGAHVAAGLITLAYFIAKSFLRGRKIDQSNFESFALYWYFVEVVWFFLFPAFYLF